MRLHALLLAAVLSVLLVADEATGSIIVRDPDGGSVFYPGTQGTIKAAIEEEDGFSSLYTGMFEMEADYQDGNGFVPLLTYCMDVDQPLGQKKSGRTYSDLIPLADAGLALTPDEVDMLEILWANAFLTSMTGKKEAGAFQVILWELTRDDNPGDVDLLSGNFRLNANHGFTDDVYVTADQWVNYIVQGTWTDSAPLYVLHNAQYQDLITSVPEPVSLSLVALGGLVAVRSRRR